MSGQPARDPEPLLNVVLQHLDGMTWQQVLAVRQLLDVLLSQEVNLRQAGATR